MKCNLIAALEKYLGVSSLKLFVDIDIVLERMVAFRLPEVEGLERHVKGLPTDLLIDICKGFMAALQASAVPGSHVKLTPGSANVYQGRNVCRSLRQGRPGRARG